MRMVLLAAVIATALLAGPRASAADNGFLFGAITTRSGDHYTGRIRWDKNEGFWDDIIDATKTEDDRYKPRHRRQSRISILGIHIDTNDWDSESSSSELQFGHIKSIEPRSTGRAVVYLKNGEKVRFEDSGTDIGSDNRGIQIDVPGEDPVELDWSDIERVDFTAEPDGYQASEPAAERLYGVVKTDDGEEFAGFVAWDVDEIYTTDILDGEIKGHDRKIPFGSIESIEKVGSTACLVRRKSGPEVKVSGTNDVDSGNRGVAVTIPELGRVRVEWDEFKSVTFLPVPAKSQPAYDQFDGGKRLHGTVTTDGGEKFTGGITWDNDERFGWEYLNGEQNRIGYDIAFANIAKIERHTGRSARVTLRNGKVLKLRNTNDVNDENEGIFIETAGTDPEEVDWDSFVSVVFE